MVIFGIIHSTMTEGMRFQVSHFSGIAQKKSKSYGMLVIADMICERVGDVVLTDEENTWAAEHFEMHKVRRARADRMSAAGYFKRRKRGRPRKPGPKGKKRKPSRKSKQ